MDLLQHGWAVHRVERVRHVNLDRYLVSLKVLLSEALEAHAYHLAGIGHAHTAQPGLQGLDLFSDVFQRKGDFAYQAPRGVSNIYVPYSPILFVQRNEGGRA